MNWTWTDADIMKNIALNTHTNGFIWCLQMNPSLYRISFKSFVHPYQVEALSPLGYEALLIAK